MEPKPISLDEHSLIGLELCAMRERLRILAKRIGNSHGKHVGNFGSRAADAVDAFREVLTREIMQTCPPAYSGSVSGVYNCTERLQALRDGRDLKIISNRILGIVE